MRPTGEELEGKLGSNPSSALAHSPCKARARQPAAASGQALWHLGAEWSPGLTGPSDQTCDGPSFGSLVFTNTHKMKARDQHLAVS